jgi:tetratricopeptide (TPR) repeat protein
MNFKMKWLLFCVPLLCLQFACDRGPGTEGDFEAANLRADSLSIKLNSPELKELNRQILEAPGNADLYHQRGRVYLALREKEEAMNDAKRAIRLDSTKAAYYTGLVDVYFSQNNTRLAKDLLEITVKKFPENTEALLKLAELYWLVRQYQNGIEYVNKALKIDPYLAKGYYIKGSIYRESGDTTRALSSLETAAEQDNSFADAYHDIGLIYAARRNPLALQYYDNALRIKPANEEARYARARLLQDLGRIDDAVTEYQLIINSNNNCAECYYNIGAIYLELKKDNAKALENFTKAIEIRSDYAEAYFARGYTYAKMKKRRQAEEDYRMSLKILPNYEPAVQGLNDL